MVIEALWDESVEANARAMQKRIEELEKELAVWLSVVIEGCSSEDGIDGRWGDRAMIRARQLDVKLPTELQKRIAELEGKCE